MNGSTSMVVRSNSFDELFSLEQRAIAPLQPFIMTYAQSLNTPPNQIASLLFTQTCSSAFFSKYLVCFFLALVALTESVNLFAREPGQEEELIAIAVNASEKEGKSYTQRLYPFFDLLVANRIYAELEDESGCINIKDGSYGEFHASNIVLASVANIGDRSAEALQDYDLTLVDPSFDTASYATLLGWFIGLSMEDSNIDKKSITFDDTYSMFLFKISANHYTKYFKGFFKTYVFYWVEDQRLQSMLSQLGTAGTMASGYIIKSAYYIVSNITPTANMLRDILFDQGFSSAISVVKGVWVPKVKPEAPSEEQWVAAGKEALVGYIFVTAAFGLQQFTDSRFLLSTIFTSGKAIASPSPAQKILTTTYTHIGKCAGYAFYDSFNYALRAFGLNDFSRTSIMTGILWTAGKVMHQKANSGIGTGFRNGFTFKDAENLVTLTGIVMTAVIPEEKVEQVIDSALETTTEALVDVPSAIARGSYIALSSIPDFLWGLLIQSRKYAVEPETFSCIAMPARKAHTDTYHVTCIGEEMEEVSW